MEDLDAETESIRFGKRPVTDYDEPQVVVFTQQDLDAARWSGYEEGLNAAVADAHLLQVELQAAAIQNLADGLAVARTDLERLAVRQAAEAVKIILAVLQGAIPATMARNADVEVDALLEALTPRLMSTPELRVRTHAHMVDNVRETLVESLPIDGCVLLVAADDSFALGDVQIAWQDGTVARRCGLCWNEIRDVLAPLGLPSLEEICCGNRR